MGTCSYADGQNDTWQLLAKSASSMEWRPVACWRPLAQTIVHESHPFRPLRVQMTRYLTHLVISLGPRQLPYVPSYLKTCRKHLPEHFHSVFTFLSQPIWRMCAELRWFVIRGRCCRLMNDTKVSAQTLVDYRGVHLHIFAHLQAQYDENRWSSQCMARTPPFTLLTNNILLLYIVRHWIKCLTSKEKQIKEYTPVSVKTIYIYRNNCR